MWISSIIVDHLRRHFQDANVTVACIYCNYKDQATQNISNLISSLLKQLVQDRYSISDNVKSFYSHHRPRDARPTLDEFTTALRSEIQLYSKVFIVVDAFDECLEDDETRAKLLGALRALSGTVNVMITSRELASIARRLEGTKRLDIYANDEDVQKYVTD